MARTTHKNQKIKRAKANLCCYCGRKMIEAPNTRISKTIEHFYPLRLGGSNLNKKWNILIACQSCNKNKNGLMPEDWIKQLIHNLKPHRIDSEYYERASKMITSTLLLIEKLRPIFEIRDIL